MEMTRGNRVLRVRTNKKKRTRTVSVSSLGVEKEKRSKIELKAMEKALEQSKRHDSTKSGDISQDLQDVGSWPSQYLTTTEYVERDGNPFSEDAELLSSFLQASSIQKYQKKKRVKRLPEHAEKVNSFPAGTSTSSLQHHDDHTPVASISRPEGCILTYQRRKRVKRMLSDSTVKSSESMKVNAGSPELLLLDSSVAVNSVNPSGEAATSAHSEKMLGEVVAGPDTLLLVSRDISVGKASGDKGSGLGCIEGLKKIKMESLKESVIEQRTVKGVSQEDSPERKLELRYEDKKKFQKEVHNGNLAEERLDKSTNKKEKSASDDASSRDHSVEKLECDNLEILTEMNDAISSSSQLRSTTDDISLDVSSKDGALQVLPSPQQSVTGTTTKKLLVLDLNGILADIAGNVPYTYKPGFFVPNSNKAVFKRPYCDDFLSFCFEKFRVGIWSSRTKKNMESVIDFLMGESKSNLLFCWDQSYCTKTGFFTVENTDKPLFLKELRKLWEKHERDLPWEKGEYNESNTLLLDDSPHKALLNPSHTAIFPFEYRYKNREDNSLGPGGALRDYLEGLACADNVQKYIEANPFGKRPITERNLSWKFYSKVIAATTSSQHEEAAKGSSACT